MARDQLTILRDIHVNHARTGKRTLKFKEPARRIHSAKATDCTLRFFWKNWCGKDRRGQDNFSWLTAFNYLRVFRERISFLRKVFFRCLVRRWLMHLKTDRFDAT